MTPTTRSGLVALALLLLLVPSCVSRKLFIRSDPPGARVLLDGDVVGTTPYEADFLSYGTRAIELELAGHRRLIDEMELERPWWQYPPFDVATDLIIPWTIESHFTFDFSLQRYEDDVLTMDDARAAYARMRETMAAVDAAFEADAEEFEDLAPEDPDDDTDTDEGSGGSGGS